MKTGCRFRRMGGCEFTLWAPFRRKVELLLTGRPDRVVPMKREEQGYWCARVEGLAEGARYLFRLDGDVERPDPASHFQPDGVHGASSLVDHGAFDWRDSGWRGRPLEDMAVYEIHVGTVTPEGTFEAVAPRISTLADLGITALELMPVAQFPGERNWGYDGAYPYAPQASYGGPRGLKGLVDACHRAGIAVILDVVYNHLGPEGNYLREFGPYFTSAYRTPWGEAVNFDGPWSDGVREFFLQNALYWLETFHVDALRIDAVHAIHDKSALPFLEELGERVDAFSTATGRSCWLIAESDLNDPRLTTPREGGGTGLHAQWNDDFHHALAAVLTGEGRGYYGDYGDPSQIAKAWREGFVYTGEYSRHRKRRRGRPSRRLPPESLVVFAQNHDQVGNRMGGERLSTLVSFETLKAAAAQVLLSPCLPLLFMGEEYGEETPFLYFVSHSDEDLVASVRRGRAEEFRDFQGEGEPPDPQDPSTFARSKLRWDRRGEGRHGLLLAFYGELLRLRRRYPSLTRAGREGMKVGGKEGGKVMWVRRRLGREETCTLFHLGEGAARGVPFPFAGRWRKRLDSAALAWGGPGETLPDAVSEGDPLILGGWSAALYDLAAGGDAS